MNRDMIVFAFKSIPTSRIIFFLLVIFCYSLNGVYFIENSQNSVNLDSIIMFQFNDPGEFCIKLTMIFMIIFGDFLLQDSIQQKRIMKMFAENAISSTIKTMILCVLLSFILTISVIIFDVIALLFNGYSIIFDVSNFNVAINSFFLMLLRISSIIIATLMFNMLFRKWIGGVIVLILSVSEYCISNLILHMNIVPVYIFPIEHSLAIYNPNMMPAHIRPEFIYSYIYWGLMLCAICVCLWYSGKNYGKRGTEI